jgi:hypothetical protein
VLRVSLRKRGLTSISLAESMNITDVLEIIYRPLVKHGLLAEMENNNYKIPKESRLRDICRKEIDGKAYIIWEDFCSKYLQQIAC